MTKRLADDLYAAATATAGFLDVAEGEALAAAAENAATSRLGPLVEVGAYLGRSTLFLASGIASSGTVTHLYSVDHHRGSEEMQVGWADHDPSLVDPATGRMDSLPAWRRATAPAESIVVGVVGDSAAVASEWSTALSLVFVDGGHGESICWSDYRGWSPHVARGGALIFHDVYPDPADGGRPPYECYLDAIASGRFTEEPRGVVGSLRMLVRA